MRRLLIPLVPLASLKLTVLLFVLAMILIFAGTLAQREMGNWDVVDSYFRSFYVAIPLRHLFFYNVPGVIPFPGGFLLIGLLLVNLVAAHTTRFKFAWKRTGILVTHLGLILLLVGEFVTGALAEEGIMQVPQGGYAIYSEDIREAELAITVPEGDGERAVVVPQAMLEAAVGGEPIDLTARGFPLRVRVVAWFTNAAIADPSRSQRPSPNLATTGHGLRAVAVPQTPVSGVRANEVNQPAAYVQLLGEDGRALGTYMTSVSLPVIPLFGDGKQAVSVGDETYTVALRFQRQYKPYTLHVLEVDHDVFVGTDIPRNFSSRVRVVDAEYNDDREALIRMNEPLRYRGDAIFQHQMDAAGEGFGVPMTGLQVVSNPGWLLPYISCILVGVGLTLHFGVMLGKFMGRRPA